MVAFIVCGASLAVAALAALAVPSRSGSKARPLHPALLGETEVFSGPAYASGIPE